MQMLHLLFLLSIPTSANPNADKFSSLIDKSIIRENLKYYTSKAHVAGSEAGREQTEWTVEKLKSWGISTRIDEYEPLLGWPTKRSLVVKSHPNIKLKLAEDVVEEDPTSKNPNETPSFLAYTGNGTVTGAELVYVNFCSENDFKLLKDRNISVSNRIVICKFGDESRGSMIKRAESFGAVGHISFTEPSEDGYTLGPVYPNGPFRPASGIQRGTAKTLNGYGGDPLTPFYPAKSGVPRLSINETALIKIPAIPIGYGDALQLLQAIETKGFKGKDLGKTWQGDLNVTYWTGPGASLDFEMEQSLQIKKVWNVIGEIKGSVEPDRVIMLSNHRDAWVYGAVDPNSGTAVLMEVARIFGQMYKEGWRPARTIMFASWDAEEYGLVGSTEWVEEYIKTLDKTLVACINIDSGSSGSKFRALSSPSMATILREVAKTVTDPKTKQSLYEAWKSYGNQTSNGQIVPLVGALGGSSDYVAFQYHVGAPSMDLSFRQSHGVYHSNYDSFHYMEKFGDPKYEYSALLTEFLGRLFLRFSDDEKLPFDYIPYAESLQKFTVDTTTLFKEKNITIPLTDLAQTVEAFKQLVNGPALNATNLSQLNNKLAFAERNFLYEKDLNGKRAWMRHIIGSDEGFSVIKSSVKNGTKIKEAVELTTQKIKNCIDFFKGDGSYKLEFDSVIGKMSNSANASGHFVPMLIFIFALFYQ